MNQNIQEVSRQQAIPISVSASRQFTSWLAEEKLSIVFSTYKVGKLFFVGLKENNQLALFERTFNRCMGLWTNNQSLYLSSIYQLWRLENNLQSGQLYDRKYDALFVPQLAYTTGDLDVHDVVVDDQDRVIFVNTLYSCLATVSPTHSFIPLWHPPFISKLAAEDRCHLNGLAMVDGKPRYVSSISQSDISDGWRDYRKDGGCIIDIPTKEIIAEGLSMPHSPRYYGNSSKSGTLSDRQGRHAAHDRSKSATLSDRQGRHALQDRLWVLNSGYGEFGYIDLDNGKFNPVTFCPGYLRGLAFHKHYALTGLSKPRHEKRFSGLPLDDILTKKKGQPRCGIQVIDLNTGDIVHWLQIEGMIQELYDVAVLPNIVRPMAIGIVQDQIRRIISWEHTEQRI